MKEIFEISKREFSRISKSKNLIVLCLILPVVLSFLFALIYRQEIVREVPIAIFNEDNSVLSRKIIQLIDSSPSVKIAANISSQTELRNKLKRSKVQAAFYFPKNFEKDIKSNHQANVIFFKNSSNILLNNIVYEAGITALKTAAAGIILKKIKSDSKTSQQAMFFANPIRLETHLLYNPNYSYEFYLVPAFIIFTLQLIILISTVISINSEFEAGSFAEILTLSKSAVKIIFGKLFAYSVIFLLNGLIIFLTVFPFANINTTDIFFELLFIFILFIAANVSIGILVSASIKDKLFSTELIVFINTPAFILSGYTFPLESMPKFHFFIAQLQPFTHFLAAFVKLYLTKSSLISLNHEIFLFIAIIIVSIIIAALFLKKSLIKENKNQ